jgi:zinc protease
MGRPVTVGARRSLTAESIDSVPGLSRLSLANGLTVYVLRRERAPLISARLMFPRGSAVSPPGQSGLAAMTAQLLRRGTEHHSAEEIDGLLEGAGSDLGVLVNDDLTRFSLTCEPGAAIKLFALLSELLRQATFPKREVSGLRERTCDQLKGSLDDAEWIAGRATYRVAFAGHPYAVPSEGWSREVASLGRKEVRSFAEGSYTARGACLVLAGAVGKIETLLRPFAALRAGTPIPSRLAAPPPLRARHVLIVDKPDATQAQIRIVGEGLARDSPELVAAILGNGVLGDGFSSRLVNEVRVNRGLTYGISSRFGALAAGGLFLVRSFTRLEKVGELVKVVLEQLERLRDEGPAEEELARVRTYLGGGFRLGTETADQVGAQVADAFRYGLGEDWLVRYPQLLDETPREAVSETLRAHLPVERYRVVAVGPAVDLEKQLKRFGTVEVIPLAEIA